MDDRKYRDAINGDIYFNPVFLTESARGIGRILIDTI